MSHEKYVPQPPDIEDFYPDYPELAGTASANGTTGMMPIVPVTNEEYAAFQELAGMEIPPVGGEEAGELRRQLEEYGPEGDWDEDDVPRPHGSTHR